jgi:hypothetical protein
MKKLIISALFLGAIATLKAQVVDTVATSMPMVVKVKKAKKIKKEKVVTENVVASTPVTAAYTEVADMPTPSKKDWSNISTDNRSADHFMIQFGYDGWTGRPDSVNTSGFGRHFNFYLMKDKPFKKDKRFSLAYGIGIGSSNIYFDKSIVDIKSGNTLSFKKVEGTTLSYFEKLKITEIFIEIPAEIRFYSNPENPNKSWKYALGAKVGLLTNVYTKGKNLVTSTGSSIYGTSYIAKEQDSKFFAGTRVTATARIGYGKLALDGAFTLTPVLLSGAGPSMNTFSIGITLSGL